MSCAHKNPIVFFNCIVCYLEGFASVIDVPAVMMGKAGSLAEVKEPEELEGGGGWGALDTNRQTKHTLEKCAV